MCIAIYKSRDVELPDKETLEKCWSNNDDGAGFCIARGESVEGYKGFMTFDDFWQTFHAIARKEHDILIHFRQATHGGRWRTATHPFPVSDDTEMLEAIHWTAQIGAVHNGIISEYGGQAITDLSDTQDFIKQVLSAPSIKPHLHDQMIASLVGRATTSKWAFLWGNGASMIIGSWEKDDETGIYFSNNQYKYRTYVANRCGHHFANNQQTLEKCPKCNEKNYRPTREICWKCKTCLSCHEEPCICLKDDDTKEIKSAPITS